VIISDRIRFLREEKKLSQGDIERRAGLLRCYVSRVENGHTVPSVETLERLARALEVPVYAFFYEGEQPPKQYLPKDERSAKVEPKMASKQTSRFAKFCKLLQTVSERDRLLLFSVTKSLAKRHKKRTRSD
jgi:transcriptional regulator with XRE-family HTH domain